jgi:hypothetical protein
MKSTFLQVVLICCTVSVLHAQSLDSTQAHGDIDTSAVIMPDDTVRQVDMIDYLSRFLKVKTTDEKRDDKKVNYSFFPSASSRTGSRTVVTSFNATFYLGDISHTTASSVFFVPYLSFNGQYGFLLQPNIWLKRNSWNFTGDYFILSYPQNTWGLGGNTSADRETGIDYNYLRIHQNALKEILPGLSIGPGYALDYHFAIDVEDTPFGDSTEMYLPADRNYSNSSGVTITALYNTRMNTVNPQQGVMGSMTYSIFTSFLGSTDAYQSLFLDARKYFSMPGRIHDVLAFRSYYWTVVTGSAPYLDLPSVRWEPASGSSSRGIEQNRYRSNAMLYFESEYRFGITANGFVGGVVFASVTSASEFKTQDFIYWHPAGGAGLRLKFNKYSRTNVALDYAFSKEYSVFYLNIGEAF